MNEEIFRFCTEIARRESRLFQVEGSEQIRLINEKQIDNMNYDNPIERIEFLCALALGDILLAKHCFGVFFSEYSGMVENWRIYRNDLRLCTINNGPAVEYVALLLQFREHLNGSLNLPTIETLTVFSKFEGWKNAVNLVHDLVTEGNWLGFTNSVAAENIATLKFKLSKSKMSVSTFRQPLSEADVIIVMKPVGSQSFGKKFPRKLERLCQCIKPGSYLLCIESKPVVNLFVQTLSELHGEFLCRPEKFNVRNDIKLYDTLEEQGYCPVRFSEGWFFVWRRYFLPPHVYSGINEGTESPESCISSKKVIPEENSVAISNEAAEKNLEKSNPAKVTEQEKNHPNNQKMVDRSIQTRECSVSVDKSVQVSNQNSNCEGNCKLVSSSTQTKEGNVSVDKCVQVSKQNANCVGDWKLVCSSTQTKEGSVLVDKSVQVSNQNANCLHNWKLVSSSTQTKEVNALVDKAVHVNMQNENCRKAEPIADTRDKSHSYCECDSRVHEYSHCMPVCSNCSCMPSNDCRYHNKSNVYGNISPFSNEDSTSPKLVLDLDSLDKDTVFQVISLLLRRRTLNSD